MLAVLDGASNVRWTDILGDVGCLGSCKLSIYDSKYTPAIVQKGNLVKFVLNGTPAFAFFNTAPKLVVGEANSQSSRLRATPSWSISAGLRSTLRAASSLLQARRNRSPPRRRARSSRP